MATETIQQQIERSQAGGNADRWEHYRRAALLELDRMGFTTLQQVSSPVYEGEAEELRRGRYRAWGNESLIWTIDTIRAGRNGEAIRGFLQVVDYFTRIAPGAWPRHVSDAFIALRNHFEDLIVKGEKS